MADQDCGASERVKRRSIDDLDTGGSSELRAEYRQLLYDRRRAVAAFSKFVPQEFLALAGTQSILEASLGASVERNITTVFCDLHNFTTISETLTSNEVFCLINDYLGNIEPVVQRHRGLIDKVVGDAVMALFPGGADDAILAAIGMHAALEQFNRSRTQGGLQSLSMCIGINTGIATLGIIGSLERYEPTAIGDAVNVASRIEAAAKAMGLGIVISDSVLAGLEDPNAYSIRFVDRLRLRGRKNLVSLYEVFDSDPTAIAKIKLKEMERFERAVALYHMRKPSSAYPLLIECVEQNPDDCAAKFYAERCVRYNQTNAYEGTDELSAERAWDPSFDTGVAAIDNEHHTLFANIKKLSAAIAKEDAKSIDEVFSFIENYAITHFAHEEALMEKNEYPLIDQQRQQHRAFRRAFAQRRSEILSGRHDKLHTVFLIDLFLTDWLINHSSKADKHFAKYLTQKNDNSRAAI